MTDYRRDGAAGQAEPQGAVTRLFNTDFWRVRDGRFEAVHICMCGTNILV